MTVGIGVPIEEQVRIHAADYRSRQRFDDLDVVDSVRGECFTKLVVNQSLVRNRFVEASGKLDVLRLKIFAEYGLFGG